MHFGLRIWNLPELLSCPTKKKNNNNNCTITQHHPLSKVLLARETLFVSFSHRNQGLKSYKKLMPFSYRSAVHRHYHQKRRHFHFNFSLTLEIVSPPFSRTLMLSRWVGIHINPRSVSYVPVHITSSSAYSSSALTTKRVTMEMSKGSHFCVWCGWVANYTHEAPELNPVS